MSSHHFVKEGQEPALFILEKSTFLFAEPLLEWVPLVMVVDNVLEDVLQWGIKIDVVVRHDLPLSKVEDLIIDQQPVQILSADKDQVISLGLQFFFENGYESVNLIGSPDENVFESIKQMAGRLQVGIYDQHVKWSFIASGVFEKWMPGGHRVFIRSDEGAPFQTDGIFQKGENWETLNEKMVIIKAHTPFWVGEQY